jgi:hypothetical protein
MVRQASNIVVSIILTLLALSAFASQQTITGIVTDTMCGKKHMVAGKSDADCTRDCMKSKGDWTYGLVVGDKVYSLAGDSRQFDSLAGKRVTVTGELTGSKLAVRQISPAR